MPVAAQSKATSTNPKDILGAAKVPMGAVPPVAIAHESLAFYDGELKYGFRNYRDKKVSARIYVDACKRHLDSWLEGEETAEDSGVHHLGHARACLGIILDAQENESLIDDRVAGPFGKVLKRLEAWVKQRNEKQREIEKAKNEEAKPEVFESAQRQFLDPKRPYLGSLTHHYPGGCQVIGPSAPYQWDGF